MNFFLGKRQKRLTLNVARSFKSLLKPFVLRIYVYVLSNKNTLCFYYNPLFLLCFYYILVTRNSHKTDDVNDSVCSEYLKSKNQKFFYSEEV